MSRYTSSIFEASLYRNGHLHESLVPHTYTKSVLTEKWPEVLTGELNWNYFSIKNYFSAVKIYFVGIYTDLKYTICNLSLSWRSADLILTI